MLLKYLFAKLLMTLNFLLFIGLPFFCAAAVFKSRTLWITGFAVGTFFLLWIFSNAFQDYIEAHHAKKTEEDSILEKSVRRIAKSENFSRVQFWVFPNPKVKVKYWVGFGKRIDVLLSQGALSQISESELKQIYAEADVLQKNSSLRLKLRLNQNFENVQSVLRGLKGDSEGFRYWFLSFWLLPFEKTLKFSTHLL